MMTMIKFSRPSPSRGLRRGALSLHGTDSVLRRRCNTSLAGLWTTKHKTNALQPQQQQHHQQQQRRTLAMTRIWDKEAVVDLFDQYARERDGVRSLNWCDIRDLLLGIGERPQDATIAKLFEVADQDGNGVIDLEVRPCAASHSALNVDTVDAINVSDNLLVLDGCISLIVSGILGACRYISGRQSSTYHSCRGWSWFGKRHVVIQVWVYFGSLTLHEHCHLSIQSIVFFVSLTLSTNSFCTYTPPDSSRNAMLCTCRRETYYDKRLPTTQSLDVLSKAS